MAVLTREHVDVLPDPLDLGAVVEIGRTDSLPHRVPVSLAAGLVRDPLLPHDVQQLRNKKYQSIKGKQTWTEAQGEEGGKEGEMSAFVRLDLHSRQSECPRITSGVGGGGGK